MAKIDLSHAAQDAVVLHRQDKVVAKMHLEDRGNRTELLLHQILPRPAGDTRPLDPLHILQLAQSIVAVGLLEPLVVDQKGRLICGGHRLAALRLLDERAPTARGATIKEMLEALGKTATAEVQMRAADLLPPIPGTEPHPMLAIAPNWPHVPVRMLDFDAERQPNEALAAETAENTQRRDYSREEIRNLAERLKGAGFVQKRGRPREGEKPLLPALAAIVGRHERTILAALSDNDAAQAKRADPNAGALQVFARLTKAAAATTDVLAGKRSAASKRVSAAIDELTTAVEAFVATIHQDD